MSDALKMSRSSGSVGSIDFPVGNVDEKSKKSGSGSSNSNDVKVTVKQCKMRR